MMSLKIIGATLLLYLVISPVAVSAQGFFDAPTPRGAAPKDDEWRNEITDSAPLPPDAAPDRPGFQNSLNAGNSNFGEDWTAETSPADLLRGPDLRVAPASAFSLGGSRGLITLHSPEHNAGTVRYELFSSKGRFRFQMEPGQTQKFDEDQTWCIRYHTGVDDHFVSYRLLEGRYDFAMGVDGWELRMMKAGDRLPPTPPRVTDVSRSSSVDPPLPPPVPTPDVDGVQAAPVPEP
ncbi:MAG: hypothetical protein R3B90_21120 [Planctomycetaceae bacterium]